MHLYEYELMRIVAQEGISHCRFVVHTREKANLAEAQELFLTPSRCLVKTVSKDGQSEHFLVLDGGILESIIRTAEGPVLVKEKRDPILELEIVAKGDLVAITGRTGSDVVTVTFDPLVGPRGYHFERLRRLVPDRMFENLRNTARQILLLAFKSGLTFIKVRLGEENGALIVLGGDGDIDIASALLPTILQNRCRELEIEDEKLEAKGRLQGVIYVGMGEEGVAVLTNGASVGMLICDYLRESGIPLAAFCDLSANVTGTLENAVRVLNTSRKIHKYVLNVTGGGLTRFDLIADLVIKLVNDGLVAPGRLIGRFIGTISDSDISRLERIGVRVVAELDQLKALLGEGR